MNITFDIARPDDRDARLLLNALSSTLAIITGSTGEGSSSDADVLLPRSLFLVGRVGSEAIACGALRKFDDTTCELKRMYTNAQRSGIGGLLVDELERRACAFQYKRIVLETRKVNEVAIRFYLKHGYQVIPNYGKYVGSPEAVCFQKLVLSA